MLLGGCQQLHCTCAPLLLPLLLVVLPRVDHPDCCSMPPAALGTAALLLQHPHGITAAS